MFETFRIPHTATRKNMKRVITEQQLIELHERNCIKNVWSVLKSNYNLIYYKA